MLIKNKQKQNTTQQKHQNTFDRDWLPVQRFSPLLSWLEVWWHAGGHGGREGPESST